MTGQHISGIIYKGIGGFYYVKTLDGSIVECKPKGLFRKQGIRPLAGDKVLLAQSADTLYIDEILPRRNIFVRPPVANIDQFCIVASTIDPTPSFLVIDKLAAVAVDQEVTPVLVITKIDLASSAPLLQAYATSGMDLLEVDAQSGSGIQLLRERLNGRLSVFCGNSGVGKSTLLNLLLPSAARETGQTSKKLGRGRHTTREVELFEVEGGLVADTPGFASFDVQRASPIPKENLQFVFPEIQKYMQECRFTGCAHLSEAGCAVREALAKGHISPSRYDSYIALYEEAKQSEKNW